jgi:hypothetical protein
MTSDRVLVFEAWRLPVKLDNAENPKKRRKGCDIELGCGRHVKMVNGTDGAESVLVDEEWPRDNFPVATIVWDRQKYGFWGTPLIDQIIEPQVHFNETREAIKENARLNGHSYLVYQEGSVNEEDLDSNEMGQKIPYTGNNPPQVVQPTPFSGAMVQLSQEEKSFIFEFGGFNEMMAQGRKEPGLDSGVALRTMNDQAAAIHLPHSRAYEWLHVQLAQLAIQATEDLEQMLDGGSIAALFPDDGFLDTTSWNDFKLGADLYTIRPEPVSSSSDTMAGRLQTLQEMSQNGMISGEAYKRLVLQNNPDIQALTRREQAQERLMEQIIGQIQDADESTQQSELRPPMPIMNLPMAIAQMSEALMEMMADGAEPHQETLCLAWIQEADEMLKPPQEQAPTATDPGMGGDSMAAPIPEMPPGPPMGAPPGPPQMPIG